MIDVKKLTIGFLILAFAGGSSALIFSSLDVPNSSASELAATSVVVSATSSDDAALNGNAFIPQPGEAPVETEVFSDYVGSSTPSSTEAQLSDPNNLTASLAEAYLNGLMAANPNGPQDDGSGNATLTPADGGGVMNALGSSIAVQNVTIPDWAAEADEVPVVSAPTSSPNIATNYAKALQAIFNQYFIQTDLQTMVDANSDPTAANTVTTNVGGALKDIGGLVTPADAVGLQKSLIKLLVYEKEMSALTQNANNDPLKAVLVFQAEEPKYNQALSDFASQLQTTPEVQSLSLGTEPQNQSGIVAFLDNIAGIQTAHAQWITFDPTTFAHMLLTYLNNILLQILKNTVIFLMQKEVQTWIHGNGVPKIIQNWGSTLANAGLATAINALNGQMQCINGAPFSGNVRLTLNAFYQPNSNVCAAQFQSALGNNLTKFYNKFANGSWLTYGSSLQPSNNYYGNVFFTAQLVGGTSQNQQAAISAKSISAQGFTSGKEVCDDGSDPWGSHSNCVDGEGNIVSANFTGPCSPGQTAEQFSNLGACADGSEPIVQTNGAATGQVFNSSVDSSPKLVTAANDITGLLNAFLSSFLNSLATDAITATTGAIQQVVNNAGTGGGGGGGTGTGTGAGGVTLIPSGQTINCTLPAGSATAAVGADVFFATNDGGAIADSNNNIATWNWTLPAGGAPATGTGTSGSSFEAVFSAPGTYTATVTNSLDGTSASCTVTVQ